MREFALYVWHLLSTASDTYTIGSSFDKQELVIHLRLWLSKLPEWRHGTVTDICTVVWSVQCVSILQSYSNLLTLLIIKYSTVVCRQKDFHYLPHYTRLHHRLTSSELYKENVKFYNKHKLDFSFTINIWVAMFCNNEQTPTKCA